MTGGSRRLPPWESRAEADITSSNYKRMDRLWICKEASCEGATLWSYDELAANGEPYCPAYGGDMQLIKASGRDFDFLSKTIRL